MGYIRGKRIRGLAFLGILAVCITGCGATAPESAKNPTVDEVGASKQKGNGEVSISSSGSVQEEETENEAESSEDGIPIYGKDSKKEIRKYLAKLPDKALSFQEAKELGVIRLLQYKNVFTADQKEYFEKKWMEFYNNTRKWKEEHRENIVHTDVGYEAAIITLAYTVEGDPVYNYISFINGEYYIYSDYSKDKFGGGFHDGSYKELRNVIEETEGEEYSSFYLLEEKKMSNQKIKQMLTSENGYDIDKLVSVYQFDYVWGND